MSVPSPAARLLARLANDELGNATTQLISWAPVWFVVFGVFMMNMQLGRNYIQRDMVDHATAVAADSTMKTLCADSKDYGGVPLGEYKGARATAIRDSIEPLIGLVSSSRDACKLNVREGAGGTAPGTRAVEVELRCDFPCNIPIAADLMCSGSPKRVVFVAKRSTVAMGCDVNEGR